MSSQVLRGLQLYRCFATPHERRLLFEQASALSQRASRVALETPGPARTSAAHNVNSEERFRSLTLPLNEGATATCEHFAAYGDGHELTYFRSRIPTLGLPDLRSRLEALPAVEDEIRASRAREGRPCLDALRWKLTLNRYPVRSASQRRPIGFPWHRDLKANGACTMILNLGAPGALEFGAEPGGARVDGIKYSDHGVAPGEEVPVLRRVTLLDGDLLLLAGPARWEALHRVVPVEHETERISLVYGAW